MNEFAPKESGGEFLLYQMKESRDPSDKEGSK